MWTSTILGAEGFRHTVIGKHSGVPIVNYGVLLARIHGVLERALKPFPLARLAYEQDEDAYLPTGPLLSGRHARAIRGTIGV